MEDLYIVSVSSLQIRNIPSEPSKVCLLKDTVVKLTGDKSRQYKREEWVKVATISLPILSGYVLKKYINKI